MDNTTQPVRPQPQPIDDNQSGGMVPSPVKKHRLPFLVAISAGVLAMVLVVGAVLFVLYHQALQPVNSSDRSQQTVEVASGLSPDQIGKKLKEEGLIRQEWAFAIHTRLSGVRNSLRAGTYQLSPSQSTQNIVSSLTAGVKENEFIVTLLPGATLEQNRKTLLKVGFSDNEIDEAFEAGLDHPILDGTPSATDLEGLLYGETHRFVVGTTAKDVVKRFLDDMYKVVKENSLIEEYKKKNLTLYEGITLASIIQRESGGGDEAQIAQVFLLRLKKGIRLGSDVTYQYIADKLGVPRDVNLDNKYNTRRYGGIPPGPIATPGEAALLAVANPAEGTYIYFLSGDDDVTYFAHTQAEHEENIRKHCQKKCLII